MDALPESLTLERSDIGNFAGVEAVLLSQVLKLLSSLKVRLSRTVEFYLVGELVLEGVLLRVLVQVRFPWSRQGRLTQSQ